MAVVTRSTIVEWAHLWSHPRERGLYRKFRERTMIPEHLFIDNLLVAGSARQIPGSVVECGTWRGGMIAAMAASIPEREYVLFDSYEGLPPAQDIDGQSARDWQADTDAADYFDNCTASEQDARESMAMAGVEARIIKGWFEETVPIYAKERPCISILRLDGDWYESTMTCLKSLYPLVAPDGVVLIDDYGAWDGCTHAVHDYLSESGAPEPIRRTSHGATYIRRR